MMKIQKKYTFIIDSELNINLDDIVDALKNSMTGRSYVRHDGLSTFVDVDGYISDTDEEGIIIQELNDGK